MTQEFMKEANELKQEVAEQADDARLNGLDYVPKSTGSKQISRLGVEVSNIQNQYLVNLREMSRRTLTDLKDRILPETASYGASWPQKGDNIFVEANCGSNKTTVNVKYEGIGKKNFFVSMFWRILGTIIEKDYGPEKRATIRASISPAIMQKSEIQPLTFELYEDRFDKAENEKIAIYLQEVVKHTLTHIGYQESLDPGNVDLAPGFESELVFSTARLLGNNEIIRKYLELKLKNKGDATFEGVIKEFREKANKSFEEASNSIGQRIRDAESLKNGLERKVSEVDKELSKAMGGRLTDFDKKVDEARKKLEEYEGRARALIDSMIEKRKEEMDRRKKPIDETQTELYKGLESIFPDFTPNSRSEKEKVDPLVRAKYASRLTSVVHNDRCELSSEDLIKLLDAYKNGTNSSSRNTEIIKEIMVISMIVTPEMVDDLCSKLYELKDGEKSYTPKYITRFVKTFIDSRADEQDDSE